MRDTFDRVEESGIVEIEFEAVEDKCDKAYPWLYSLFIKVDATKNSEVYENFLETKEAIIISLTHNESAKYVGMRMVDGWSELYFYAKEGKNLDAIVSNMLKDNYFKYEANIVKDLKWDFYHKNLYPSELEFIYIDSAKIISELEEEGDDLSIVRDVEHYASFDIATQRDRFVKAALDAGYSYKDDISSEEFDYGVALVKEQSVTKEAIFKASKELYELAKKEHGYYELWSTTLCLK